VTSRSTSPRSASRARLLRCIHSRPERDAQLSIERRFPEASPPHRTRRWNARGSTRTRRTPRASVRDRPLFDRRPRPVDVTDGASARSDQPVVVQPFEGVGLQPPTRETGTWPRTAPSERRRRRATARRSTRRRPPAVGPARGSPGGRRQPPRTRGRSRSSRRRRRPCRSVERRIPVRQPGGPGAGRRGDRILSAGRRRPASRGRSPPRRPSRTPFEASPARDLVPRRGAVPRTAGGPSPRTLSFPRVRRTGPLERRVHRSGRRRDRVAFPRPTSTRPGSREGVTSAPRSSRGRLPTTRPGDGARSSRVRVPPGRTPSG